MPTLDWIGKKAVVNHHKEVPYRLIKCEKVLSAGEAGEGNLLVEGDNLHALKALLPYGLERPEYILQKALEITNLNTLLSQAQPTFCTPVSAAGEQTSIDRGKCPTTQRREPQIDTDEHRFF